MAPLIFKPSRSGLEIAFWAASIARFSPLAIPHPISASPLWLITALTSAKSTLINPSTVIISAIPLVASYRTSFGLSNAAKALVDSSRILNNLSFGITIKLSTCFLKSCIPCSAFIILSFPSHRNGLVTIPTTNAPILLAIEATIGAPPVPVPPPIPAVTKTISLPERISAIFSRSSSMAFLPIFGSAPAPSPLVIKLPT